MTMTILNLLLISLLVAALIFSFGRNREWIKKFASVMALRLRSNAQKLKNDKGGLKSLIKNNSENDHICSLCKVSNNPSLKICWHCGHDF